MTKFCAKIFYSCKKFSARLVGKSKLRYKNREMRAGLFKKKKFNPIIRFADYSCPKKNHFFYLKINLVEKKPSDVIILDVGTRVTNFF